MKFTDSWLDKRRSFGLHQRVPAHSTLHPRQPFAPSVDSRRIIHDSRVIVFSHTHAAMFSMSRRAARALAQCTECVEHWATAGRVNRRYMIIAPAIATDPNSSSIIQPGTTHGRPIVRRCQT